jgi:1,4-dihydroxy-2-naphthoate octaprenyltransferase
LKKSTIQLLRFPFSWLLLPVYLFALAMADQVNWWLAWWIFLLIHVFLYPASNGYNSYMDRDEGSIGGVKHPMAPTRELYRVSVAMDLMGTLLAFFVSMNFGVCYAVYIVFSRLYSYRGIRLKQYPVIGYLTVILNQGALVFYMVYVNVSTVGAILPWQGLVISTLLIGAFYPITQVYQHDQDRKDGVTTISYRLGVKGTFVYCGSLYLVAFILLATYFYETGHFFYFIILQVWYLPVIILFLKWAWDCWKDTSKADFKSTMRMNWVAATCTNLAFISVIIYKHFG